MFCALSMSSNGYWRIVDSDFIFHTYFNKSHEMTLAVIYAYRSKSEDKRFITENVKLYYSKIRKNDRIGLFHQDEKFFRNHAYFCDYYPCLKRHVQKLQFIGK